jgi:hypothetical protein
MLIINGVSDLPRVEAAEAENAAELSQIVSQWSTWIPTLTWSTATPDGVTVVARYKLIGKTLFVMVFITATNGNGATTLNVSMPGTLTPIGTSYTMPLLVQQSIGGAITSRVGTTRETDKVLRAFVGPLTAGSTATVNISGVFEVL